MSESLCDVTQRHIAQIERRSQFPIGPPVPIGMTRLLSCSTLSGHYLGGAVVQR